LSKSETSKIYHPSVHIRRSKKSDSFAALVQLAAGLRAQGSSLAAIIAPALIHFKYSRLIYYY
jgi:hypothetical protein